MSGVYHLDPDGAGGAASFQAYCEMVADGGGWTLVMKIDGTQSTFLYDAALWSNATTYQATSPDLDKTEAKLASFSSVGFTALRVGMIDPNNNQRWIVVNDTETSLQSAVTLATMKVIDSGAAARAAWKSLLVNPAVSLQANCNQVVFNRGVWPLRVRLGLIANQEGDCNTPDSFVGFGGGYTDCLGTTGPASGNVGSCSADLGDRFTTSFGYIMVR